MSVRIDAAADLISRTANMPTVTTWTSTCWAYVVATRSAFSFIICYNNSGATLWVGLNYGADNLIEISRASGTTNFGTNISINTWYFFGLRMSAGTITGFISDVAGTMQTATNTYTPSFTPVGFCWGSDTVQEWCSCRVAAIKLWDVALSDAEVAAERLSILPSRLDGLNEFWPCFPGATERLAGYSKARNLTAAGTLTDETSPPVPWSANPLIVSQAAAVEPTPSLIYPPMSPAMQAMLSY